ncbi:MAG TPA: DJ-1/PfpI family protein [Oculatellaceae cyanobacterium]
MTNFQALLFDGFDEMDIFGAYEALRMANFEVPFKSLRSQDFVAAQYGVRLKCDEVFSLSKKPDVLLVPGGGWLTRAAVGAWAEAERGDILGLLAKIHAAGVVIATVCTGSLLLARAGILKDRPATTNHAAVKDLIQYGAVHVDARVVDDGDIITASGITSSIDLGIWLVERFGSQEEAIEVSERLEFERRGVVFSRSRQL